MKIISYVTNRGELDKNYNQIGHPSPPVWQYEGGGEKNITFAKKASNELKCIFRPQF